MIAVQLLMVAAVLCFVTSLCFAYFAYRIWDGAERSHKDDAMGVLVMGAFVMFVAAAIAFGTGIERAEKLDTQKPSIESHSK